MEERTLQEETVGDLGPSMGGSCGASTSESETSTEKASMCYIGDCLTDPRAGHIAQ